MRPDASHPAARLLVLSHHGIGDTVMNLPFLRNLRRAEPDAEIHVTVKSGVERAVAVQGLREMEGVVLLERSGLRRLLRSGGRFTAGFSLGIEPLKAWALFRAVRARRTFGYYPYLYRKPWWSFAYTAFLANPERLHKVELSRRLFLEAYPGSFEPLPQPWLSAPPAPAGLPRRYVAFHPGSGEAEAHKRWPLERFALLARRLKERHGVDSVLLGGPSEKPLEARFREAGGEAVSLIGACGILDTLGALGGALAVVGGDSGILHLGAALGRPSFCITGPTDARITGPSGEGVRIFASSLPCAPCYGPGYIAGCGRPECMKSTEWQAVAAAVEDVLAVSPVSQYL